MPVVQDSLSLQPGHYASVFISERPLDPPGYAEAMEEVMRLAEHMDGYLGFESLRNGRDGIFISYWRDRASVEAWAQNARHQDAKRKGVAQWYDAFRSVNCRVEDTRCFRREVEVNPE